MVFNSQGVDRHGSKPLPQPSPNVVIVFIKLVRANRAQVFKASTISNVRRNQTILVHFVSCFRQKYASIPVCYVKTYYIH